jgi:hypothetical protein
MQQWAMSVVDDIRAPLEASETCPEAMWPEERQKPYQHAAGLLLFDDTSRALSSQVM